MLRLYYFIVFASFGVFLPFLPPWLENLGITGRGIGLIAALRPLTAIVSPVIFGMIADRFGLRGVLISIACFLSAVAMGAAAFLGMFPGLLGFGPVMAIIGLYSFFRAPVISIADVTTMEGKKQGYGTVRLWGSTGFLVAALVAGMVGDPSSPVLFPAAIAGGLALAGLVSFTLPRGLKSPPRPVPGVRAQLFESRDFRLFLWLAFLWLASHSAYDVCLSLHLMALGGSSGVVGAAWALGTVFEIALMAFAPRLLGRFPPTVLIILSVGTMTLRWIGLAFTPWIWLILVQQPLHALSFALFWLACIEYVRRRADKEILATAQGTFSAAASLGSAISMLVWGSLYDVAGGRGVFLAAALVGAAAWGVAIRLRRIAPASVSPKWRSVSGS